jgi:hypothetical protein
MKANQITNSKVVQHYQNSVSNCPTRSVMIPSDAPHQRHLQLPMMTRILFVLSGIQASRMLSVNDGSI